MKFQTCDICEKHIIRPEGKLRLDLRLGGQVSKGYIGGAYCTFLCCADCKPKMIDSQAKIKELMENHLKSLKEVKNDEQLSRQINSD